MKYSPQIASLLADAKRRAARDAQKLEVQRAVARFDTTLPLDEYEVRDYDLDDRPLRGTPTRELVQKSAESPDGKVFAERTRGAWRYVRSDDTDENSRLVYLVVA